ncbi:MAG: hypothetical protein F6K13_24130 [Okeania sp. SIO2B9]|nr:hypothetical protein [Okeania sp. SIO2B9]
MFNNSNSFGGFGGLSSKAIAYIILFFLICVPAIRSGLNSAEKKIPSSQAVLPSKNVLVTDKTGYCYPEYQRLTLDTYNECIILGMTYNDVVEVIGNYGNAISESGGFLVWSWNENNNGKTSGKMIITFANGKAVKKTQYNLSADSRR